MTSEGCLPTVLLMPGELYVAEGPLIMTTLLGSCVSVCVSNRQLGIGGMSHSVLPASPGADPGDFARYVDSAFVYLMKWLHCREVHRSDLVVKIFGGADMFKSSPLVSDKGIVTVGAQNIRAAREIAHKMGLRITSEDVGGNVGRKIFFFTHTGEVLLRRIPLSHLSNQGT